MQTIKNETTVFIFQAIEQPLNTLVCFYLSTHKWNISEFLKNKLQRGISFHKIKQSH